MFIDSTFTAKIPGKMFQPAFVVGMALVWWAIVFSAAAQGQASSASNFPSSDFSGQVKVDGLVIERQKYSFTLQTHKRNLRVVIPNGTLCLMKLTKPEFDLGNQKIRVSLMLSAADGVHEHDKVLEWSMPDPPMVTGMFRSQAELDQALNQPTVMLDRFVLDNRINETGPWNLTGVLTESRKPGKFYLDDRGGLQSVRLGQRRGLLGGFTISDLKPMQTSVWVQGQMVGDETVVADRIRFEYLGNPENDFNPNLPRLLSLGDITSFDYHKSLIQALDNEYNVHHPPTWLGPSKNWNRLHHYVGLLDPKTPMWDVITFNYGMRDFTLDRQQYQDNLKNAIAVLQRTGARLIWVNSTPLPNGLAAGRHTDRLGQNITGQVPGRMRLQNRWAQDVLMDYPEITTCDLWSIVDANANGLYDKWWAGTQFNFYEQQAKPLGQAVADAVLNSKTSPTAGR